MTKLGILSGIVALALASTAGSAIAASLQVSPVLLEVPAPGAATSMVVRNTGDRPIMSQLRVFRWTQSNGVEKLEPTDEVVASPPSVELKPKQDYTVRLVRTAKRPVAGEEFYRVVVDELPDGVRKPGTVAMVLRHSVPLFFQAQQASSAAPVYSVAQGRDGVTLRVDNRGDRRIQLSALTVRDASGRQVSFGAGLVGYALGRSTMQWTICGKGSLSATSGAMIIGNSETGKISAKANGAAAP